MTRGLAEENGKKNRAEAAMGVMIDQYVAKLSAPAVGARTPAAAQAPSRTKKESMTEAVMLSPD